MTTLNVNTHQEIGIVTFELAGSWSVGAFADWLGDIADIYRRLNAFYNFGQPTTDEYGFSTFDLHEYLTDMASGNLGLDGVLRSAVEASSSLGLDLLVRRIELASPGVAEFIGSMNPLKVVGDVVGRWREISTDRARIATESETERLKIVTDAEIRKREIDSEIIKELVRSTRFAVTADLDPVVGAFLRYTLDQPISALEQAAMRPEVTDVSVRGGVSG